MPTADYRLGSCAGPILRPAVVLEVLIEGVVVHRLNSMTAVVHELEREILVEGGGADGSASPRSPDSRRSTP